MKAARPAQRRQLTNIAVRDPWQSTPMVLLLGVVLSFGILFVTLFVSTQGTAARAQSTGGNPPGNFQVYEFRRYTINPGERERFAQYFESYCPEAFQQLGAIAVGSFFERDKRDSFTWIRGFHSIEDRAIVNGEFYYGPVWLEHRKTLNALIADSDNVMLLHALGPDRSVTILPAVDPVKEPAGAAGVVVAEIFSVKPGAVEEFARQAEPEFAKYRATGAREAGVLVTLEVTNNFPQLPVRTDGPFLVWLGTLLGDQELEAKFNPARRDAEQKFLSTGLLRGAPELVVMHPTRRSRMRWLPN